MMSQLKPRVPGDTNYLRWLRRCLDTYVSLPLLASFLLAAIWTLTVLEITGERARAKLAAEASLRDIVVTYEAQLGRSLESIDQTLRVLKYAVERRGASGALLELGREGLLPPGVVFAVSVIDRNGRTVSSHPLIQPIVIGIPPFFAFHRVRNSDTTFVSQAIHGDETGWRIKFTRRINDKKGRFAGVVVVEADPAYFTSSYEHTRLGEDGMLGLIGSDEVVRVLRIGDKLSVGHKLNNLMDLQSYEGVQRLVSIRKLSGVALSMVVGLSEAELMAEYVRQKTNKLWQASAASVVLVLATGLLWLWSWQGARSRARVRRAQETYAAASAASLDAFFIMRELRNTHGEIEDFTFVDVNSRAEKMTGFGKDQLKTMTLCGLLPIARDNGMFDHLVHAIVSGGVHEQEWESSGPLFGARWLHQQVVPVENGLVAIVRDISERKLAESRLAHLAQHDALTGLPNRSLISDRLSMMIAQARRRGGTVVVAFIDLDGFKLVNDGLGHSAGDELLRVVAKRMSTCLRAGDTVGRFGGDEFVLVLSDPDDGNATAAVLERVRETVVQPVSLGEQEVRVSCSIGVAIYPHDGGDVESLLMHADTAMYQAKDKGKNNCQFFARNMSDGVESKLSMLEDMRCAIEQAQFKLVYQPIVDLHTGDVCGAEALLRWDHPIRGRIGPDRFIPLAEESGMIVEMGDWVMRTACTQNRAWQEAGLPPMRVAINVSPRQFEDTLLVDRVMGALLHSGLESQWLELEVTEGVIMRDVPEAIKKMSALRSIGVYLSIDDFGTGYSSLLALKTFPVNTLKIDKSFVRDIESCEGDQVIASSIITLAHRLRLRVVAEGVETPQQQQFLSQSGCDEMQGYLYSHPLPPEHLPKFLSDREPAQWGRSHQLHTAA
jgi:diguanylate cyclase (GGDEF)-like protein